MQRLPLPRGLVLAVTAAALTLLALPSLAAAGPARFDIGIQDPFDPAFNETDTPGALAAMNRANVRFVRVPVAWSVVAPTKPNDASNHEDPAYRWTNFLDERVRLLRSRGFEPILAIHGPPQWAWGRTPDGGRFITAGVNDFRAFMRAIGSRYRGAPGLPQPVRYWEIWNEPNLRVYFQDTPGQYRDLLNAAYEELKGVNPDNFVIGGALAPFVTSGNGILGQQFMREALCVSASGRRTCNADIKFDAWSVHPYTSGGPRHSASAPGNISLGNLGQIRRILQAGRRVGNVNGRPQLWNTEFSWDTRGPDPGGVPLARHKRWVAEAMYRMWTHDITTLIWFQLRDNPEGRGYGETWQAGLYFRTADLYENERRKPFANVIAFPFAAVPEGSGVTLWGRTPGGGRGTAILERRAGRRWRRVARVRSSRGGVFRRRIRGGRGRTYRARVGRSSSVPYKATPNRDIRVNPFGGALRGGDE